MNTYRTPHRPLTYISLLILITCCFGNYSWGNLPTKINGQKIHLNIYYQQAKPSDTLFIAVDQMLLTQLFNSKKKYIAIADSTGCFRFEIPVHDRCGYFILYKNRAEAYKRPNFTTPISILEPQFWEKGDSLNVHLSFKENASGLGGNGIAKFKGRGAQKYQVAADLKYAFDRSTSPKTPPDSWNKNLLDSKWDAQSPQTKAKLSYLLDHKAQLSELSYNVIKANLIYESTAYFTKITNFIWSGAYKTLDEATKKALIKRLDSLMNREETKMVTEEGLSYSLKYNNFLAGKYKCASWLNTGSFSLDWIIDHILKSRLNTGSKEELLMREIFTPIRRSENMARIYQLVERYIKNPAYLELISQLKTKTAVSQFTDFKLQDINGNYRTLKEFSNKVILLDFWFTGCGKCGDFYTSTLSKVEQALKHDNGIVFISISIDRQKTVWKKSVSKGIYTSPEAINLYTGGSGGESPVIKNNLITGYPTVVLLDKSGKIKYSNTANLYKRETLLKTIKEML